MVEAIVEGAKGGAEPGVGNLVEESGSCHLHISDEPVGVGAVYASPSLVAEFSMGLPSLYHRPSRSQRELYISPHI